MKIIIRDTAHNSIDDIFEYLCIFSANNALATVNKIYKYIYSLENSPYIGRYSPYMEDKHFRELIYKKNKNSTYKIMYYISENTKTIHVIYISDCKQDFNRILKTHNYFKNLLNF